MKRWAQMNGAVCLNVVEQEARPTIAGVWEEVTGNVGPGCRKNSGDWVLAPQPARLITIYAFWSRWTPAERVALLTASESNMAALDFRQMVDRAQYIDLDDSAWSMAMPQLAALTILTSDRATAILAGPVLDKERP